MRKISITGEIVTGYLDRFPQIPNLTLAKKIYSENSEAFNNVEHVRKMIGYYIGQQGEKNRKTILITKYVREARTTNPFELPE